jgi:hypothetical protein
VTDNWQLAQRYFRAKRRQLLAMSDLAVAEHAGLRGSHREELQRIYLRDVLPQRFSVGHGMVYGFNARSNEADIVIWDADNYPSLPLTNTSFFFAESVRVVLESKSDYEIRELKDVLRKCRSVINIIPVRLTTLGDQIFGIHQELDALRSGAERPAGMLIVRPRIGTAAVFIHGGRRAIRDLGTVSKDLFDEADVSWPDVMLWLEPGRIALKQYPEGEPNGRVELFDCGEDSFFVFTNHMLRLLADRSVPIEDPFYMDLYMRSVDCNLISSRPFPLMLPRPGRRAVTRDELYPQA